MKGDPAQAQVIGTTLIAGDESAATDTTDALAQKLLSRAPLQADRSVSDLGRRISPPRLIRQVFFVSSTYCDRPITAQPCASTRRHIQPEEAGLNSPGATACTRIYLPPITRSA